MTSNVLINTIRNMNRIIREEEMSRTEMLFDKAAEHDCGTFSNNGKILAVFGTVSGRRRYYNDGWNRRNKKSHKWQRKAAPLAFGAEDRLLQSALDKGRDKPVAMFA